MSTITTKEMYITKKYTLQEDLLVCLFINENTDLELINNTINNCLYNFIFVFKSKKINNEIINFINANRWKFIQCNSTNFNDIIRECFEYALKNNYKYLVEFEINKFYNIAEIWNFHNSANKGYDLIIADRTNDSFFLSFQQKMIKKILNIKKVDINDPFCQYRLFNWSVMKFYLDNPKLSVDLTTYKKLVSKNNSKIISMKININDIENFKQEYIKQKTSAKYFFKILF